MFIRIGIAAALAAVAIAAPASADAAGPQVTDACGDAGTTVEAGGEQVPVEENRPYLDIAEARISGRYAGAGGATGVSAAIRLCGAASQGDGGYSMAWSHGDRCWTNLTWAMGSDGGQPGVGAGTHGQLSDRETTILREQCYREQKTPLEPNSEVVYEVTLPARATTFSGNVVTFDIQVADLPAAATRRFVDGSEWSDVRSITMDQAFGTWAGYRSTNGDHGDVWVRYDAAFGGASFVVGSDREDA